MLSQYRAEFERYSTFRPEAEADYVCVYGPWHDYSHIKGEDNSQLVETCVRCGHEIRFVKSERGRIDNVRYGETHMLYFVQSTHPFFRLYYPHWRPLPDKKAGRAMAIEEAKEEFRRVAFDDW